MSSTPAQPTSERHSLRLLTLATPHARRPARARLSPQLQRSALEVLTTITGAPSAIPPSLWQRPLGLDDKPYGYTILERIFQSLAQRLPVLNYDELTYGSDLTDLSVFLTIPVYPYGLDTCNGDFEGYGSVISLLAHLEGYCVYDVPFTPSDADLLQNVSLHRLIPYLDRERPPLNGLAAIAAMLCHTTGTLLLDACPGCFNAGAEELLEWTDENLVWLEQDTVVAGRIFHRTMALEAWVEKDRARRLKRVWNAIRRAHKAYLANPQPPRTYTLSAEDFVAGRDPHRPKTLAELWGGEGQIEEVTRDAEPIPLAPF